MLHDFSRTELLLGQEAIGKLKCCKVAVFGIGGVGSFAVEALVRTAVGNLVLIDHDYVDITNINRQLIAIRDTIGRPKVEVMKERILSINPNTHVDIFQEFYMPNTAEKLLSNDYDYIVDAIDTVTAKIDLIVRAKEMNIPIISSMGAGNKVRPELLEVDDIYNTSVCPLAKVMRKELRNRGVKSLKVVYSKETPIKPAEMKFSVSNMKDSNLKETSKTPNARRQVPGSVAFVPSVAGLIIAGEVIKDLVNFAGQ